MNYRWLGLVLLAGISRADDKKYYWEGSKLNNLGRLSNPSPDFEEDQKSTRLDREKDQYLANIREQINHQAATNAIEMKALQYAGKDPGNALEVTHGAHGVEVTLHAELLFDDNSTSLKSGAADVLTRLRGLLEGGSEPIHLLVSDVLDEGPQSRSIDAERSLAILAPLALSNGTNNQEN